VANATCIYLQPLFDFADEFVKPHYMKMMYAALPMPQSLLEDKLRPPKFWIHSADELKFNPVSDI